MARARKNESFHQPKLFDPIQYVKQLESVGFTREQAEMQAETFFSIVQEQLVTKQDLKASGEATQREISATRLETKELEVSLQRTIKEIDAKTTLGLEAIRRDIKELDAKTTLELEAIRRDIKELDAKTTFELEAIRRDIKESENKTGLQLEVLKRDLKIWFGRMLITLVAVFSAIVALMPHLINR